MKRGHEIAPSVVLGVLLAGLAGGCVAMHGGGETRQPTPLPPELTAYYQFPPIAGAAVVHLRQERERYTVCEVSLPTAATPAAPIRLLWFAPRGTRLSPLILISPIKGSNTLFTEGFAEMFAAHGWHAVIVRRPNFHFDPCGPLTQVETILHDAVIRNRQALDWLLAQPGVDPQRVGSLGISYGAIVNAALAGVEPRVRAHVFGLGGGPVVSLMKTSLEHSLQRNWRQTRRYHDLTNRELYQQWQTIIQTDPLRLAPHVDPDRVLMVIALFDHSVASANQLSLWHALGKPETMFVPLGHYTSILALPFQRAVILRFFEDQFAKVAGPPERLLEERFVQNDKH